VRRQADTGLRLAGIGVGRQQQDVLATVERLRPAGEIDDDLGRFGVLKDIVQLTLRIGRLAEDLLEV